ncbi:MAG: DUF5698 domain-containing protein [Proteobacteria bacterium]|nr:DUF5698 domain-containing protein [Pseudomonadota bacterium]
MRIFDVALGTIRTISVVQGRIPLAVCVGFFEVLIWVSVVSQVIIHIRSSPWLAVAFAAGSATGYAVGIMIERFVALGTSVVRMISQHQGYAVAGALRETGQAVTTFDGEGRDGHCLLIYAICPRRQADFIIKRAREIDPNVFYIVEAAMQVSTLRALAKQTSWRNMLVK